MRARNESRVSKRETYLWQVASALLKAYSKHAFKCQAKSRGVFCRFSLRLGYESRRRGGPFRCDLPDNSLRVPRAFRPGRHFIRIGKVGYTLSETSWQMTCFGVPQVFSKPPKHARNEVFCCHSFDMVFLTYHGFEDCTKGARPKGTCHTVSSSLTIRQGHPRVSQAVLALLITFVKN